MARIANDDIGEEVRISAIVRDKLNMHTHKWIEQKRDYQNPF